MAGPHKPFGLPDSDLPHQKYMYVPGLSKVASFRRKSPPTWLVSAGYSALHFFTDGIF